MADFRQGVRAKMVMAITTNGYDQQQAEALADANLDTCEPVAQAAWDAAITERVSDGWNSDLARVKTIPDSLGAAWQWAKDNVM